MTGTSVMKTLKQLLCKTSKKAYERPSMEYLFITRLYHRYFPTNPVFMTSIITVLKPMRSVAWQSGIYLI